MKSLIVIDRLYTSTYLILVYDQQQLNIIQLFDSSAACPAKYKFNYDTDSNQLSQKTVLWILTNVDVLTVLIIHLSKYLEI